MVQGLPLMEDEHTACNTCKLGKQSRMPFSKASWRIYFLKFKPEVPEVSSKFKALVENQSGCRIQMLRSGDGIKHQITFPHTPQQNGVNEWRNTSIMEMLRGLLYEKFPTKVVKEKTPFEAWNSTIPKAYTIFQSQTKNIMSLSNIYQRCNMAILESSRFEEAVSYPNWKSAMEEELAVIENSETWHLVEKSQHRKIICVKWVYCMKLNVDGSINKLKARLVLKG
ncbi:uncharacterized protein LOC114075253 [Solanum pennellii]|uniref:Uncharacterized protein LOC114075253 n=1 Tax=Solanum pennellii TaxID=28526 RepID=A0ABM1V1D8_SOLPN|nr:uncharacterized protein LOC114075253 [Solanum pennellii]